MPEFYDVMVRRIDERLRELAREVAQLERARAALTDARSPRGPRQGSTPRSRGRSGPREAPTSRTASRASSNRSSPGGTTTAVLAALKGGEAMTATEVAAAAGLARPTVSTTLSKLARSRRVEKAKRGYRLASAG